jgi:hypothetical protein
VKIEIRKSFEKDTAKLPAGIQAQLAIVIQQIITENKLSALSSVKKAYRF